jgi:pyridoxine 4-dehydrogenase
MTKQTKLGGSFSFPDTSVSLYRMGYGAMQLGGSGFGFPHCSQRFRQAAVLIRRARAATFRSADNAERDVVGGSRKVCYFL